MITQKDAIINKIKTAEAGIVGCYIPMLDVPYTKFVRYFHLDIEASKYRTLDNFIQFVDYTEKRHYFENIGFNVLFMTLSNIKASKFVQESDANPTKTKIEEDFLNGKRNVFLYHVQDGLRTLIFVLEYKDTNDPLCHYTVDKEQYKQDQEDKEALSRIFKLGKYKNN